MLFHFSQVLCHLGSNGEVRSQLPLVATTLEVLLGPVRPSLTMPPASLEAPLLIFSSQMVGFSSQINASSLRAFAVSEPLH